MGALDTGDLGNVAAVLLGKLGTTVCGIFWQISASTKKRFLIQNYSAIYHLPTKNQALIKHVSRALLAQCRTSDAVFLAPLAATRDGSSSLRWSWFSMRALWWGKPVGVTFLAQPPLCISGVLYTLLPHFRTSLVQKSTSSLHRSELVCSSSSRGLLSSECWFILVSADHVAYFQTGS